MPAGNENRNEQHGAANTRKAGRKRAATDASLHRRQHGTEDGSVRCDEARRIARTKAGASPCTAPAEEMTPTPNDVRFNVLRNALMHTMRQRHFDALHRSLMFFIVLTGTAGVGNFFERWVGREILAAVTAVLATLDLVLDLRGKASLHSDLRRRYYLLLAEIERSPNANAEAVFGWQSEMVRITADEPDLYQIVDCVAYNRALNSLGRNKDEEFLIPLWRRLMAHCMTFGSYTPPIREEVRRESRHRKRLRRIRFGKLIRLFYRKRKR